MTMPVEIVKGAREAAAKGVPAVRRPTTFPGVYGPNPPEIVTAPESIEVGKTRVPPWCQSCAESLSNQRAIAFVYDFYPQTSEGWPDLRSSPTTWYVHVEECKHIGMGVKK